MRRAFYFLIGAVFLFLGIRSMNVNRWSRWDWGDAQTLMAAQHFAETGFLKLRFLWLPQGYARVTERLDRDPLRHHAHGSAGDMSGVGPKLLYTHWPSFYSVPYGVLAKMGIDNKSVYQWLAIFLSCLSLLFFYRYVSLGLSPVIGFAAVFVYVLHPAFLDYADSLATMPYDDLFRFGFLYYWTRFRSENTQRCLVFAGLCAFASIMTTLDSAVFIPVSAVLIDRFCLKRWDPRGVFLVGAVFAVGLAIQFLQNSSYMGLSDAWADWRGYFLGYGHAHEQRLRAAGQLLRRASGYDPVTAMALGFLAFFINRRRYPRMGEIVSVFLFAGAAFAFILPGKVAMVYEGRQLAPYFAIVLAALIVGLSMHFRLAKMRAVAVICLFTLAIASLYRFTWTHWTGSLEIRPEARIDAETAAIFGAAKSQLSGDKVYFQIGPVLSTSEYVKPGYGQAHPVSEYLSGGLVLTVPDPTALLRDLKALVGNGEEPFHSIVLTQKSLEKEELRRALKTSGLDMKVEWLFEGSSKAAYLLLRNDAG